MGIKKQEFYEGAALHQLARAGKLQSVCYKAPFFFVNSQLCVLMKYSTKIRSPWGFTFTPEEQSLLLEQSAFHKIIIALICGSDGIAAFGYTILSSIARRRSNAVHVACHRQRGEHYEISGPDGIASRKISPSHWIRILDQKGSSV